MAGLRELKVHLKSVRTTGQLSNAMKTVSTAKYSRINSVREKYRIYADTCKEMLRASGGDSVLKIKKSSEQESEQTTEKTLYVVLTGNRGLCGGYNSELLKQFEREVLSGSDKDSVAIISCGKKGNAFMHENGIKTVESFVFSDIPSYEDALTLSDIIIDEYTSGRASKVVMVYRRFQNMLKQTPVLEQLLPSEEAPEAVETEVLCVPSKDRVCERLAYECIRANVYGYLLECACGFQAATMMTMRSASDNAKKLSDQLEIQINRRRQSDVTEGVIETSSGMYAEYNEGAF